MQNTPGGETKNNAAYELLNFINSAPTPFHAVSALRTMLENAGAQEIALTEIKAPLRAEKLYYTVFGDVCLAAFIPGKNLQNGIRIGAAHLDYPVLKIKSAASSRKSAGIERLNVEVYGGTIQHTWLDRPLKIAGRVYFKDASGNISYADITSGEKTFIIPSAAIHLLRDVNENAHFSVQNELLPFFGIVPDAAGKEEGAETGFLRWLAETAGNTAKEPVNTDHILSFDLSVFDGVPAGFAGAQNEFLSAPGLDDRAMIHALFSSICMASAKGEETPDTPAVAFAFNHEECGSLSHTGARSAFVTGLIKSICTLHGCDSEAGFFDIMQRSIAFSADMAHATHPAYEAKSDANIPVRLGKGPVLKAAANQSYATSPAASAFFIDLCKSNGIPFQQFANHSDARGGGTIGPMLSASLGIPVADIGNPMLAMHAVRELCAASDQAAMQKLLECFFCGKQ